MADLKSLYSKIDQAKPNAGGVYVLPGVYDVTIQACKHVDSRNGKPMFVVEMTIDSSSNAQRPVGSTMSWLVNMAQDSGPSNVRGMVAGITGAPFEQVTGDVVLGLLSDEQPLRGQKARITASQIKTRAGNDFTKVTWVGLG